MLPPEEVGGLGGEGDNERTEGNRRCLLRFPGRLEAGGARLRGSRGSVPALVATLLLFAVVLLFGGIYVLGVVQVILFLVVLVADVTPSARAFAARERTSRRERGQLKGLAE